MHRPRRLLIVLPTLYLLALPLWGQPVPVSPGNSGERRLLTEACPTFHWGETAGAKGYELLVFPIDGSDGTKAGVLHETGGPALRELLPAGTSSWTPSLDRCLTPGARYAWTVRLAGEAVTVDNAWSQARHFTVRERSRLERILERAVRRLVEEGELSEEDVAQLGAWGLTGGERRAPETAAVGIDDPSVDPLVEMPILPAPVPAMPLIAPAAGGPSRFVGDPLGAVFQVDGTGNDRGIYTEADEVGLVSYAPLPNGFSFGVFGRSESNQGTGLGGHAAAATGVTYGVHAQSDSTSGMGVFGWASAGSGLTYGVQGRSASTSGRAVQGWATAGTGTTYGVYGLSDSTGGLGVFGRASAGTGATSGIYGQSSSTSGRGVFGWATAGTGTTYGVYGLNGSTSGRGVFGHASADTGLTRGVYGLNDSTNGRGVVGYARADSGTNYGVRGRTASASGYDFYASGAGTNYGPFTGGHEVRLADDIGKVEPGLVVSVTGNAEVREENGAVNLSSTLPTVTLSNQAEDPMVFGVLVAESELSDDHWYAPGDGERFATVNALGEGRVWVTDVNGPVRAGDYLTTSDVPGHAQRQGDGILRNYTLGKVIETVDWQNVTETVEHKSVPHKRALLAVVYTSG